MKKPPFSYAEAKKLCEEHQTLIGRPYNNNSNNTVDIVAIAPYNQVCKDRFIMLYLLLNDLDLALTEDYNGPHYDVIVIAGSRMGNGLQYQDLKDWLYTNLHQQDMPIALQNASDISLANKSF